MPGATRRGRSRGPAAAPPPAAECAGRPSRARGPARARPSRPRRSRRAGRRSRRARGRPGRRSCRPGSPRSASGSNPAPLTRRGDQDARHACAQPVPLGAHARRCRAQARSLEQAAHPRHQAALLAQQPADPVLRRVRVRDRVIGLQPAHRRAEQRVVAERATCRACRSRRARAPGRPIARKSPTKAVARLP